MKAPIFLAPLFLVATVPQGYSEDLQALKNNSPFGDRPPPPPPPVVATPKASSKPAPVREIAPPKPEIKLEFRGVVHLDNKRFFTFRDKSSNVPFNFTIPEREDNVFEYIVTRYDQNSNVVTVKKGNFEYQLKLGEELNSKAGQKQSTSSSYSRSNSGYSSGSSMNYGTNYGGSSSWNFDDWDDWDDDWDF